MRCYFLHKENFVFLVLNKFKYLFRNNFMYTLKRLKSYQVSWYIIKC